MNPLYLLIWCEYLWALENWFYDLAHIAIDNHHRELLAYIEHV